MKWFVRDYSSVVVSCIQMGHKDMTRTVWTCPYMMGLHEKALRNEYTDGTA